MAFSMYQHILDIKQWGLCLFKALHSGHTSIGLLQVSHILIGPPPSCILYFFDQLFVTLNEFRSAVRIMLQRQSMRDATLRAA
jgi:hypothetical protein